MVSVGEPFSKNTMLDRKQSVKSGDLEDLEEVLVDADERERATRALQPLQCADDHAKPGRVDEPHLQEVDRDPPLAVLEKRGQPLLELRRGVEVELAAELDEMGLGVDLVVGELEPHGPLAGLRASSGPLATKTLRSGTARRKCARSDELEPHPHP